MYDRLMAEMWAEDTTSFFNYLRMFPETFDEFLHLLTPRLSKIDTNFRKALEPGLKLVVIIRQGSEIEDFISTVFTLR